MDGKEVTSGKPLTKSYIESKTWLIVKAEVNGAVTVWKLQAYETYETITITPVDDKLFHQDRYKEGHTIDGVLVSGLNIKW